MGRLAVVMHSPAGMRIPETGIRARLNIALIAVLVAIAPAAAASQNNPDEPAIVVAGQRLPRLADARRSVLFGTVDLYSAEIFMPAHPRSLAALRRSTSPRAVRIRKLTDATLPDHLPPAWSAELGQVLSPAELDTLRTGVSRMGHGRDLWVIYAKRRGTTVSTGGATLLAKPGADLMQAMLNILLLHSAVSVTLRDQLLQPRRSKPADGARATLTARVSPTRSCYFTCLATSRMAAAGTTTCVNPSV